MKETVRPAGRVHRAVREPSDEIEQPLRPSIWGQWPQSSIDTSRPAGAASSIRWLRVEPGDEARLRRAQEKCRQDGDGGPMFGKGP